MNVKILISDREYSDYKLVNINTEEIVECSNINIFLKKIFNNDILMLENNSLSILQSQIRNSKNLAGVLVLENNITYGR